MATLEQIEKVTAAYAARKSRLAEEVAKLQAEREAALKRYLPGIKKYAQAAREAQDELRDAIADSERLFEKPRTRTLHGIRIGFRKGNGKVEFEDGDQVVKLIRKHLPDRVDILVITQEKPNKETIAQLEVADLKKIACTVDGTGDVVYIKDADTEVDKFVKALLKEDREEVEA